MNADMIAARLPGGRRGQALAIGIGLAGILCVWMIAVQPLIDLYQDRAETLERQSLLRDHMQAVVDTLPALTAAAAGRPSTPAITLLTGNSDAVAAASLQQMVQRIASEAGTSLTAVETLPAAQAGQWRRIPLRVTLSAPWPALMHLLRGLETAQVQTVTSDIHFHSATLQAHPVALPIQATFVVAGFRPAG